MSSSLQSSIRVCPVPGEPGRYLVASATEVLPWLVDLGNDFGEPRCACAIAHHRERARWDCRHIVAAQEYARGASRMVWTQMTQGGRRLK